MNAWELYFKGNTFCYINLLNVPSFKIGIPTFMSVPPWLRCPSAPKGYLPLGELRSERAEMAFSPLYGGVQLHRDNGSCVKSLYLKYGVTINIVEILVYFK